MQLDPCHILLATVIVAAIIVVAILASQRRRRLAEKYTVVAPVTPLAYSAMAKVLDDLALIGAYGANFLGAACGPEMPNQDTRTLPAVDAAKSPVKALVAAADAAKKSINRTPPSFYNYQKLYLALSGSDAPMAQTAGDLADIGYQAQQYISQVEPGGVQTNYYIVVGDSLIKLGGQIRALTRDVHNLGTALDME